eukprot:361988-Chlamydomonas_euryale.AAC.5
MKLCLALLHAHLSPTHAPPPPPPAPAKHAHGLRNPADMPRTSPPRPPRPIPARSPPKSRPTPITKKLMITPHAAAVQRTKSVAVCVLQDCRAESATQTGVPSSSPWCSLASVSAAVSGLGAAHRQRRPERASDNGDVWDSSACLLPATQRVGPDSGVRRKRCVWDGGRSLLAWQTGPAPLQEAASRQWPMGLVSVAALARPLCVPVRPTKPVPTLTRKVPAHTCTLASGRVAGTSHQVEEGGGRDT